MAALSDGTAVLGLGVEREAVERGAEGLVVDEGALFGGLVVALEQPVAAQVLVDAPHDVPEPLTQCGR